MRIISSALGLLAIVYLCGCATAPLTPVQQSIHDTPIFCSNDVAGTPVSYKLPDGSEGLAGSVGNCDDAWGKAIYWITQNSSWRIKQQTNDIIVTYGPSEDIMLAYTINKVPIGNGVYQIIMKATCGNPFGCVPDEAEVRLKFNSHLGLSQSSVDPQVMHKSNATTPTQSAPNLKP